MRRIYRKREVLMQPVHYISLMGQVEQHHSRKAMVEPHVPMEDSQYIIGYLAVVLIVWTFVGLIAWYSW